MNLLINNNTINEKLCEFIITKAIDSDSNYYQKNENGDTNIITINKTLMLIIFSIFLLNLI